MDDSKIKMIAYGQIQYSNTGPIKSVLTALTKDDRIFILKIDHLAAESEHARKHGISVKSDDWIEVPPIPNL